METFGRVMEVIVKLGLAVYEAVKNGDRHRTVGEIFDGVTSDMSELDRLELARFGPSRGDEPTQP